jgi:tetratricopeptide (TPR) repeat protein
LERQEKYEEAEKVYRRAINEEAKDKRERISDRALTVSELALVLCNSGKFEESEVVGLQAITLQSKEPVELSKATSDTLRNLVSIFVQNGRYAGAEVLGRGILPASQLTFGIHHEDLGMALYFQQKDLEAEYLFRQVLSAHGDPESEAALEDMEGLACALLWHTKNKEAFTLYRRALAGYRKIHGLNRHVELECAETFPGVLNEQLHGNSKLFNVEESGPVARLRRRNSEAFVLRGEGRALSQDTVWEQPPEPQSVGETLHGFCASLP